MFGVQLGRIFILLCLYTSSSQAYLATVIEYNAYVDDTPTNVILKSVENYDALMSSAQASDIIVFPEYGLTGISNVESNLEEYSTFLPDPTSGFDSPCESGNYSKALIDLSCAVKELGSYVVVNLIEKAQNETNGTIYFNANVVFDRSGRVIAKYRKINLYQESYLTPGNEIVTFTTDFGVTFGLFTSYDILFKNPAIDILANNTVTDIIYPTLWHSEAPFGVSLSVQAGYARAYRVNLLAAGYNDALEGITGSGIYYYNGSAAETYIAAVRAQRSITRDVPQISTRVPLCEDQIVSRSLGGIIGTTPDVSTLNVLNENLENYTFVGVDTVNSRQISETVCSGAYCCTFNISIQENSTNSNGASYKLAAFHGIRQLNNLTLGVRTCALLACASADSSSCGSLSSALNLNTTFQSISVVGNFSNTVETYDVPLTLLSDLQPLFYETYSYCQQTSADESSVSVSLITKQVLTKVLAFGIFGRVIQIDGGDAGQTDTALSLQGCIPLVVALILVHYLVRN